ncbi:MAG TPA: serine hydrolase domain-containing protein [Gemmatimonadaceae bacterium]|nr:serine hydrolase domain-containing protein [Gemmatimonadaceae bacterium]
MNIRLLAISLAAYSSATAQQPASAVELSRLADSLARFAVESKATPSIAIAVVRGTDTLALGAWGTADIESPRAATAATIYRIGSVTKQFTAATVMQFVEQGKVKLDDSIAAHVPDLPAAWRRVTIRQLLNHTSGIPSYTDLGPSWVARWGEDMTPSTIVSLTAKEAMWFAPGTSWQYDNTGYVVLGMLVERIAGRPWADDIIERFAKPLGLRDTRVCDSRPTDTRAAHGYRRDGDRWRRYEYISMTQPYAAGALCSTLRDLAAWNRALNTGKVVSSQSYAQMTTPEGAARANGYGFGIGRGTIGTHTVISHGGGIHGFATTNQWIPDAELSVTVFVNAGDGIGGRIAQRLTQVALGFAPATTPARVPITTAELQRYAGVYSLALPTGARDFTFTVRDGELVAQLAGQGANKLFHVGNHAFGADFDRTLRITFVVENGRAVKLVLEQGGQRFEAPRK